MLKYIRERYFQMETFFNIKIYELPTFLRYY